jgi:hypothetical protein
LHNLSVVFKSAQTFCETIGEGVLKTHPFITLKDTLVAKTGSSEELPYQHTLVVEPGPHKEKRNESIE